MVRGAVLLQLFVVLTTAASFAIGVKRKCVLHYELQSFVRPEIYANAKRICEDSGRYLAKINTTEISEALKNVLTPEHHYYIGLTLNNVNYKWKDGEQIGSFHNWKSGANRKQACVVADGADGGKWIDYGCSYATYFVCQRTLTASANISFKSFLINDENDEISCSTPIESICPTTVRWYDPYGNEIPTSSSSHVYQKDARTRTEEISKLVLTKANISHEGNYSCKAQVATKVASKTVEVLISLAPFIESVNMTKCSSVATVFWKPSSRASGLPHLLKYYLTSNKSDAKVLKLSSAATFSNKLYNLLPYSNYSVEISPCKTDACTSKNPVRTTFNTGVTLPKVTSLQLTSYDHSCYVKWAISSTENNEEFLYTVTVEENFYKTRNQKLLSVSANNVTNTSYVITMTPNRKYAISVQVIGCEGVGEIIKRYSEVCVGVPKAPNNVKKPTLTSHQTSLVAFIEIPDETSGLISCLFVIVSYKEASETSLDEYNLNDLMTANGTSGRNEYIAVAIPYSKFSESKRMAMLLGDRSTTLCDLHKNIDDDQGNYAYSLTFAGENKPLSRKLKFRVYIVAAVPYKSKVTLKRSEGAIWNPISESETTTKATILERGNCTYGASPTDGYQIDARYLAITTAFIPLIILALLFGRWLGLRARNLSESVHNEETHNYQQVQLPGPGRPKTCDTAGPTPQKDFHHYSDITPTYEVPAVASAYEEYRA